MIRETLSRKQSPALTSDRWHVLHARWSGETSGEPRFERQIVSEHDDRDSAASAARKIMADIAAEMAQRPRDRRDQIFIRKPAFTSLKSALRLEKRRR